MKAVQRCVALSQLLVEQNFPAIAIHRAMTQEERLSRYQQFKNFQKRILVATNLFGRGMDIERVNIVFNYDMPEDSDTYLHRVARARDISNKRNLSLDTVKRMHSYFSRHEVDKQASSVRSLTVQLLFIFPKIIKLMLQQRFKRRHIVFLFHNYFPCKVKKKNGNQKVKKIQHNQENIQNHNQPVTQYNKKRKSKIKNLNNSRRINAKRKPDLQSAFKYMLQNNNTIHNIEASRKNNEHACESKQKRKFF